MKEEEKIKRRGDKKNKDIELINKINLVLIQYGNKFGILQQIATKLNTSHTNAKRICNRLGIKLNSDRIMTDEMKLNLSLKFNRIKRNKNSKTKK